MRSDVKKDREVLSPGQKSRRGFLALVFGASVAGCFPYDKLPEDGEDMNPDVINPDSRRDAADAGTDKPSDTGVDISDDGPIYDLNPDAKTDMPGDGPLPDGNSDSKTDLSKPEGGGPDAGDMKQPDMPNPDVGPDMKQPDMPNPDVGPDMKQPDMPNPDVGPDMKQPDMTQPDMPTPDTMPHPPTGSVSFECVSKTKCKHSIAYEIKLTFQNTQFIELHATKGGISTSKTGPFNQTLFKYVSGSTGITLYYKGVKPSSGIPDNVTITTQLQKGSKKVDLSNQKFQISH